jgi:hypothetical protein
MTDLVGQDVGFGEVAAIRAEPALQLRIEGEVDVDGLVERAVVGPVAELAPPHADSVALLKRTTRAGS